tara:strand:+ start:955 stop:1236 length:282 start_codon:yes stop_codon:yes gene_type:complete
MNAKLVKKLRKRIKPIQVEWMKSLLPDEQADKVTVNNVEELLPDLQHVNTLQGIVLSYMTDKWIMKRLKRNPDITTYNELMEKYEDENLFDGS